MKLPHHVNSGLDTLTWKPLRQFNLYRILLALGLLTAYFKSDWMPFLGSLSELNFIAFTIVFLISGVIFLGLSLRQSPTFEHQVMISNASDIVLITLLAHFSGGLSSSLGLLLIINVTATGTFLKDRVSFLFAALASISILIQQTYSTMSGITDSSEYARAGLLGLVFFATSFLASVLSKRVRESEQLAIQQKADIISLQKLNEDIIQNMRTGIIVVDNDGHIRMANSSAESLLGHVDLQKKPLLENILPALDERFLEWQEQPQMNHKPIRQDQGLPDIQPGFRHLSATGDTLIFLEDATQLNQRFQQMKLASLGRLTASIAHEIRNPLSAINHAAQLLQESELDISDTKLTSIITAQVQRLDGVVKNVLQLSKQQESKNQTIELSSWLEKFKNEFILSQKILPDQLLLEKPDTKISILFDDSQLNQILSNLVSNAIAHHHLDDNQILIRICCGFDQQQHQPFLDIIDNGPGIEEKTVQQIFDPFFTTSTSGTGLGLYISKEMLETNRAKIRYLKTRQGGSCFRILFLSAASDETPADPINH